MHANTQDQSSEQKDLLSMCIQCDSNAAIATIVAFGPEPSFLGVRSHEMVARGPCKICDIALPDTTFARCGSLAEVVWSEITVWIVETYREFLCGTDGPKKVDVQGHSLALMTGEDA